MKLSHLQLEAFHACSQTLNVSQASQRLGLTQSALSQRLAQLESDLEVSLFIRDPKGLILTPEGEKLLRYTESARGLESDFLSELKGEDLSGQLTIAGYSSIMRSKIIPMLSPFLRKHPLLRISFLSYDMEELHQVLRSSRADFVIVDQSMSKKGIRETYLFDEEYVVIESSRFKTNTGLYLDHNHEDSFTNWYLGEQEKVTSYERAFMGDVYGIIQGVEEGLGRAVMSKHLVESNTKLKILKGFKTLKRPVTLHHFEKPFYPSIQKQIYKVLTAKELN